MDISIIGAGYVGLTTAVGLAVKGHRVVCIDTDEKKIGQIKQGRSPIWENNLDTELCHCIADEKSFKATSDYREILDTQMTFICVGTPSQPDGSIDLSHIENAVRRIGMELRKKKAYHAVVTRSTIIPGTTRHLIIPVIEKYSGKKAGKSVGIAVAPEFIQEGKALETFLHPNRIIIGEYDRTAGDMLVEISRDFNAPIIRTDVTTAEMIKYAANAFLATKISFINEIGNICQKFGVDVYSVAEALGHDPRIGRHFLNAGVGFGGSCLPKDLYALICAADKAGYRTHLIKSVLTVNENQAKHIVEMARWKLGCLNKKKITILGLAFKPDTDDMRCAPSIRVIAMLLAEGAIVSAHDPRAMANAMPILPLEVKFCHSLLEAIEGSDCVLILTEWNDYKDENLFRGKTVIDGRRTLDPQKARLVCDYDGICW